MAIAKVEKYNGYPALFIDGKVYPPMSMTVRTNDRDALVIDKEHLRALGESGIKLFYVICDTEWLKPGALKQFSDEVTALLEAIPDAYVIARIGLHPPVQWIKDHPEECLSFADGKSEPVFLWTESYVADLPDMYSLSSSKWREDAGKALADTYDAIEKMPFADRIAGYFLAAGGTSEWYYIRNDYDNPENAEHYGDTSPAFHRHFSKYLTEIYGTDEALQKAWHRDDVTLADPPIPSWEQRFYYEYPIEEEIVIPPGMRVTEAEKAPPPKGIGHRGSFVDPDTNMQTLDYMLAWHRGTADSIIHFAKIIKEKSAGNKVVGSFYGSWGCTNFFHNGTTEGTLRILDSGAVDFLAAPGVYQNRHPGGFTGQREMNDSFTIRNRMFIVEEDTRTHAENNYFNNFVEVYDMRDTLNVLKRDFGRNLSENLHAWWFDQLLGGKRMKYKECYDLLTIQQRVAHESYELDRTKGNEIAFIFDEESGGAVANGTTYDLVEQIRNYEIARIGAGVDQYFHDDMANPDMPDYKLYVFCNVFILNDEEREAIHKKLAKNGAVALFLYGQGVMNFDADVRFSAEHVTQLTGIEMAVEDRDIFPKFKINGEPHPAFEGLAKGKIFGWNYRLMGTSSGWQLTHNRGSVLYPYFRPVDKDAVYPGYFLETKEPALAVKKANGFTSVWYGAKCISCDFLRAVAKFAGVHIYSDSEDVIYSSKNYVTIHASRSGMKTLYFPERCSPYEIYEDKYYAKRKKKISFYMEIGDTKTFQIK